MISGPTRWHYAACVLLCVVIGVGAARFGEQTDDRAESRPAPSAVRVTPHPVSPADSVAGGFDMLLPKRLPREAHPPAGSSCDEVYRWARKYGGEDVWRGRVGVRLTARRFANLTVRAITVRTVASEPATHGSYLQCFAGSAARDDMTCLPRTEDSGCPVSPVFAAGAGDSAPPYDAAYPGVRWGKPYRELADYTFALAAGESYQVPVTVLCAYEVDASYVILLELEVNGRRLTERVDDDGRPFRIRWRPGGMGFHPPTYTWREGVSDRLEWDPGS